MALDYKTSNDLTMDMEFRGRVKIATLTFAKAIMDELPSVPAHNARMRWANSVYQNPDMVASSLTQPVVLDAAVQDAGAAITDQALQGAVETTVNKLF